MKSKVILGIIGLIFLITGAIAGVYLVQQQQLLEKKAVVTGGVADMSLSPSSQTVTVGDQFDVDIVFQSYAETISGATVKLTFPFDPAFTVDQVVPNDSLINDHQWRYQVTDANTIGSNVEISVIATDTSTDGYTSPGQTTLATIKFRANLESSINLDFDASVTELSSKTNCNANDCDVLGPLPSPAGTYTAGSTNPSPTPPNPSATPTTPPNPSATPTTPPNPSNTPPPNPSPTPDNGDSNNQASAGTPGITVSISNGHTFTTTTPTFTGTAAPYASIDISISSGNPVTGSTGADADGNWSWTVPTALAGGSHTGTFSATAQNGETSSVTVDFNISTTTGSENLPEAGYALPTLALLLFGIFLVLTGLLVFTV